MSNIIMEIGGNGDFFSYSVSGHKRPSGEIVGFKVNTNKINKEDMLSLCDDSVWSVWHEGTEENSYVLTLSEALYMAYNILDDEDIEPSAVFIEASYKDTLPSKEEEEINGFYSKEERDELNTAEIALVSAFNTFIKVIEKKHDKEENRGLYFSEKWEESSDGAWFMNKVGSLTNAVAILEEMRDTVDDTEFLEEILNQEIEIMFLLKYWETEEAREQGDSSEFGVFLCCEEAVTKGRKLFEEREAFAVEVVTQRTNNSVWGIGFDKNAENNKKEWDFRDNTVGC